MATLKTRERVRELMLKDGVTAQRAWRLAKGLTVEQVAQCCDMPVSAYEYLEVVPQLADDARDLIAAALDLQTEDLEP